MNNLKGKKVLVLGLGVTGIKSALYLARQGAIVKAVDERELSHLGDKLNELKGQIDIEGRLFKKSDFEDIDFAIVSPGIRINSGVIKEAIEKGVNVYRDTDYLSQFVNEKIIAVTGTNGKSTVVTLVRDLIEACGKSVFLGGNIGSPLAEYLLEDKVKDFVLLELSSFQLETAHFLKPKVAVILNTTEDHLDRYSDYDEYIEAKLNIFKLQDEKDFALVNNNDEVVKSRLKKRNYKAERKEFSVDDVEGVFAVAKGENILVDGSDFDVSERNVSGRHNLENITASIAVVKLLELDESSFVDTIKFFKGLAHRSEFIKKVSAVSYYNDSKATNIGSLESALEGLDKKAIIIAGGVDKGADFNSLRKLAKEKVRVLILIGRDKEKINNALGSETMTFMEKTMASAVKRAALVAVTDEKVILCPGCASFDMYKNYEDRGMDFAEEVRKL